MREQISKWTTAGKGLIRSYLTQTIGASAVIISLTIPAVLGSMGIAIDSGQIYLAKKRLEHAIDAAALAAAGSSALSEEEMIQRVYDFIEANYSDDKLGEIEDIIIRMTEDSLSVSASVYVDTIFFIWRSSFHYICLFI